MCCLLWKWKRTSALSFLAQTRQGGWDRTHSLHFGGIRLMPIAIQARLNVLDTDFQRWVEWGGVRKVPTETEVSWWVFMASSIKDTLEEGLSLVFPFISFPLRERNSRASGSPWRHLSLSHRCTTFYVSKNTILHACANLGWSHSSFLPAGSPATQCALWHHLSPNSFPRQWFLIFTWL